MPLQAPRPVASESAAAPWARTAAMAAQESQNRSLRPEIASAARKCSCHKSAKGRNKPEPLRHADPDDKERAREGRCVSATSRLCL